MLEAYFEVVSPDRGLPLIGDWTIYGLVTELIGVLGLVGILVLIGDPAAQPAGPRRAPVPVHRLDHVAGLLRRVRSILRS